MDVDYSQTDTIGGAAMCGMGDHDDKSACPRCEGTGRYRRLGFPEKACAVCNGTGAIGSELASDHAILREFVRRVRAGDVPDSSLWDGRQKLYVGMSPLVEALLADLDAALDFSRRLAERCEGQSEALRHRAEKPACPHCEGTGFTLPMPSLPPEAWCPECGGTGRIG